VIHVDVTKLGPDKTGRLRSWLAEVQTRGEEARVTLANEGVRHERALLVDTPAGPLLIYVIECEDYDAAREAFAQSRLPIDLEHKQVMSEVSGDPVPAEVLLDIRA
jgi:hypothetical protein